MTKRFFAAALVASSIFASAISQAYEMGIVGGVQTTNIKVSDSTGTFTTSDGTGIKLGLLGFIDFSPEFMFRTGALYTQRKYSVNMSGNPYVDAEISYLDIPLTALYMFNEYAGVFGGAQLGLKVGGKCSFKTGSGACTSQDVKSMIYGLEVGGHFRFVPNFGLEVAYTLGMSDVQGSGSVVYKNASGLSATLIYLF